jgi:hypothetical protein
MDNVQKCNNVYKWNVCKIAEYYNLNDRLECILTLSIILCSMLSKIFFFSR